MQRVCVLVNDSHKEEAARKRPLLTPHLELLDPRVRAHRRGTPPSQELTLPRVRLRRAVPSLA